MGESRQPAPALHKRATRRALIGGALTAGSVAVAYAAFGDSLRESATGTDSAAVDPSAMDAAALSKESVRINHLLRRAGFGASPAEYDRFQTMGLEATVGELVNYTSVDDQRALDLAATVRTGPEDREAPALWWLTLMANTKRPLQEKMTLFWHGLLTSQISVVRDPAAMLVQNEFFRAHAVADLRSILRGITHDPAMMVYLDTAGSQRRAPNENYARELMELFALGEGNYTEQDVREAARAFTGWTVPRTRLDVGFTLEQPVYRPQQFDSGKKSFLGREGEFRADDIVQIITEQSAASRHIVRQLYAYFIHDAPSNADIEPFVRVFDSNQQRVGPVVEAMLRSDVFYSLRAYRSLVKSPIEYVVGAIKALDLQEQIVALTNAGQGARGGGGVLGAMGQIPFDPPNVAGWPAGRHWFNSTTLYARLNFINTITGGGPPERAGNADRPNQARRQAQQQQTMVWPGLETAAAVTSRYLPLLLDDNLPDEARALLLDYPGSPDATLTPEVQRGLAYLMLASPQYHLS